MSRAFRRLGSNSWQNAIARVAPPVTVMRPLASLTTCPAKSAGSASAPNHSAVPSCTRPAPDPPRMHCTEWNSSCASVARGTPVSGARMTALAAANRRAPEVSVYRQGVRPLRDPPTLPVAPVRSKTMSKRGSPPTKSLGRPAAAAVASRVTRERSGCLSPRKMLRRWFGVNPASSRPRTDGRRRDSAPARLAGRSRSNRR